MKKLEKFKSSRLLKGFELNENKLSNVLGGTVTAGGGGTAATGDYSTNMDTLTCGTGTYTCPDSTVDHDH